MAINWALTEVSHPVYFLSSNHNYFLICHHSRGLVRKCSQVIQRYYVQYLSGYDAIALDQAIQVWICTKYSSLLYTKVFLIGIYIMCSQEASVPWMNETLFICFFARGVCFTSTLKVCQLKGKEKKEKGNVTRTYICWFQGPFLYLLISFSWRLPTLAF